MRPSTPPDQVEAEGPADGIDQGEGEMQGRGEASAESKAPSRAWKKRPPVSTKTTGRKLHLPDDVHDRLWQLSRQRRTTVSAIAAEILDRNLPRFKVEREG